MKKLINKIIKFIDGIPLVAINILLIALFFGIIVLFREGITRFLNNFFYTDTAYTFGQLVKEFLTLESSAGNDFLVLFVLVMFSLIILGQQNPFLKERRFVIFILLILSLLPTYFLPELFEPFYLFRFREPNILYYHVIPLSLLIIFCLTFIPDRKDTNPLQINARGFLEDAPLLANNYNNESGKFLINQICNRLDHTNNVEHSFCVGIEGPRGSGKTSLIYLLINTIKNTKKQYILVDFKPWLITDVNAMEEELLKLVIKAISSYKINVALNNYWKAFELADSKFLKVILSLLGLSSTLHKPFEYLRKLFKQREQKILIIIDDFDRLDKEQMCAVIKIIKQITDLPFFQFVVAFDQAIVAKQLDHANELEKIVTAQFTLPNISNRSIYNFMKEKCKNYLVEKYSFDFYILDIALNTDTLNTLIKNYREAIRIINSYILDVDLFFKNNQSLVGENDLTVRTNIFILNIFKHSVPEVYLGLKLKDKNYINKTDLKYQIADNWNHKLQETNILFSLIANLFSQYINPFDFSNLKYYDKYFTFGLDSEDVTIEEVRKVLSSLKSNFSQKDTFNGILKDHIKTLVIHNKDYEQYIERITTILQEKFSSSLSANELNEFCEIICEIVLYERKDAEGLLEGYHTCNIKNLISLLNQKTSFEITNYIYQNFYCNSNQSLRDNDQLLLFFYDYFIEWQQDYRKNKILMEKILLNNSLIDTLKENFENLYLSSIENFQLIFDNDWKIYWYLYNVVKAIDMDQVREMNEWIINTIISNKNDPRYIKILLNNSIVVHRKSSSTMYNLYRASLASQPNLFYIMDQILYVRPDSMVSISYSEGKEAQFQSDVKSINNKLMNKIGILSDEHKAIIDCFIGFSEKLFHKKYIPYNFGVLLNPAIKEKDDVTLVEKIDVQVQINNE